VTRNLWHSCVRVPVAAHFSGKPAVRRRTWSRWVAAARACGPVTVYAQKTRIVIQHRVRFAGAIVHHSYVDAGVWLHRRAEHPRLRRVEDLGSLGVVHYFRLEHPDDVDASLIALLREAYTDAEAPRRARS
jgi:hypothetical protein